jgi:hypothetical protein
MKKSVLLQNGLMDFSFVKKSLLGLAIGLIGLSASAQTSINSIPHSDGTTTYAYVSPISVAGGAAILIGSNSSYDANNYWDLTAYTGIEFKVTFPSDANGTVEMRLVMVGTSGAQSLVKSVTAAPGESAIVSFDFVADGAQSNKLWAIKFGWGTSASPSYNLTIDHINVLGGTTAVPTFKNNADSNRLVNVYNITGKLVRSNVKLSVATVALPNGLYIVDGKKVIVNK